MTLIREVAVKQVGILIFFLSVGVLLTVGIAETTGLALSVAGPIALIACVLLYLMLDLKPEPNPGEETIVRLTRGSWYRKKK